MIGIGAALIFTSRIAAGWILGRESMKRRVLRTIHRELEQA